MKILFICGNDTIAKSMINIYEKLSSFMECEFSTLSFSNENAEYLIGKYSFPYVGVAKHTDSFYKNYKLVIIGNDWGSEIKSILLRLKALNKQSILVQESSVKFNDKYNRYKYADIIFLQGQNSLNHIKHYKNKKYVLGNPRYNNYDFKIRKTKKITINVNFTYGIFENRRDEWLSDILSSLQGNDIDVIKHPRDLSNLDKYNIKVIDSNAESLVEKLDNTQILITRFSSLIHESLLLGIPVIYYNLFNEEKDYDFKADNKVLYETSDKNKLSEIVNRIFKMDLKEDDFQKYLSLHFKLPINKSISRINEKIVDIYNEEIYINNKFINRLKSLFHLFVAILKNTVKLSR
jgi:hypothetical protein